MTGISTRRARLRNWLSAAALLLLLGGVLAGEGQARDSVGHGWAVVPGPPRISRTPEGVEERSPTWVLLHLPPRETAQQRGVVRQAATLLSRPEALGSWGNQVFLVFGPDASAAPVAGGTRQRRVVSLAAMRGGGSSWYNEPEGRFASLAPLPGEAELIGLVGTSAGPVVMERAAAEGGDPRLRLLTENGTGWRALSLPPHGDAAPDPAVEYRLLPWADGCAVLALHPHAAAELWTASVDRAAPLSRSGWDLRWSQAPQSIARPWNVQDEPDSLSEHWLMADGRLVASRWDRGILHIAVCSGGSWSKLPDIAEVPSDPELAAVRGSAMLALLWPDPDGAGVPAAVRFQIVEIGIPAGTELYRGPPKQTAALSQRDLEVLTVMGVVLTVAILLTIMRPQTRLLGALPEGVSLAPAGRRLLAAAVDLAAGLLAAGLLLGLKPVSILDAAAGEGSVGELRPLLVALGICWAESTLGEWLVGASLGKLIVRCRVMGVVREPGQPGPSQVRLRRPTLRQAAVRNLVRWTAPPVTVFALADPAGRHPGDLAADTLVVVRRRPG